MCINGEEDFVCSISSYLSGSVAIFADAIRSSSDAIILAAVQAGTKIPKNDNVYGKGDT